MLDVTLQLFTFTDHLLFFLPCSAAYLQESAE
jgi:hypothetical protein